MRLLSQVVKVAVGQLSAFSGNLHSETSGDAVGALSVHQSESLEVPWRKDWGHLQEHIWKRNQAPVKKKKKTRIVIGHMAHYADGTNILEKEAKSVYQKTYNRLK